MIVNVDDKEKIKKVIFKYPQLVNSEAEDIIIKEYDNILKLEENLYEAREEVRSLEKEIKDRKRVFNELENSIFTLEFEKKEITTVDKINSGIAIVNPTDASNKQYTRE